MRPGPMWWRVVLGCALCMTAASAAVMELPSRAGAVPFDHGRHITHEKGNCTACHHTSTGANVEATCRQCHQPSARAAMPDSRTAFHGSCIGCHEKLQRGGQATGPTKRCSGCHTQTK